MSTVSLQWKKFIIFLYDRLAIVLSIFLAFGLRHNRLDWQFYQDLWSQFTLFIFLTIATKMILIQVMRISKGMWRFSSIIDLRMIITMSTISMVLIGFLTFAMGIMQGIPRSVIIIDWLATIFLLGGARFCYRLYKERNTDRQGKTAILIGAGDAAEKLIRDYYRDPSFDIKIIGLLDDDFNKIGRTIYGFRVLGPISQLEQFIDRYGVEKVIIAIPTANSSTIRKIVSMVPDKKIEVKTLPKMSDIIEGKVTFSQLRSIKIDDLLGRDPVTLKTNMLDKTLNHKTILVTGAGGSIGSELVRQITRFRPEHLILLDIGELCLFNIENELKEKFPNLHCSFLIADVRDEAQISQIILQYTPDIIYHAAAYKHVPLMEKNPLEAIKTNILGTHNVIKAALRGQVKKFILISTDKAVNPTSVMGASKKIAELLCHYYSQTQKQTSIVLVRFGNVLGSNGSVVPRFIEQIKKGGPLTITSKKMTRYFMSIPEASQLVLQSSSIGSNGQILVLDMGEAVRIYDLALQMIKLSGLQVNKDIEIKEIGLRPGEKLFEELFYTWEELSETGHPKIKSALSPQVNDHFLEQLEHEISQLLAASSQILPPEQLNSLVRTSVENIIHNGIIIENKDELPRLH